MKSGTEDLGLCGGTAVVVVVWLDEVSTALEGRWGDLDLALRFGSIKV